MRIVKVLQGGRMKCMLIKDPDNILIKTGKNTRVGRQISFGNV